MNQSGIVIAPWVPSLLIVGALAGGGYFLYRYCARVLSQRIPTAYRDFLAWCRAWLGCLLGLHIFLSIEHAPPSAWALLNALVGVPMIVLAIAGHEAAHALAASSVGLRPFFVMIGFGKILHEFEVRGCTVTLHARPLGGFTMWGTTRGSWLRLRYWIAIAAGPAFSVSLFLLILRLLEKLHVRDIGIALTSGVAPLPMLLLASLAILPGTLIPMKITTMQGPAKTDAWHLLTIPFYSDDKLLEYRLQHKLLEVYKHLRAHRDQEALATCEQALTETPNAYPLPLIHTAALDRLTRWSEARTILLEMLSTKAPSEVMRCVVLNNLAWMNLMLERTDLLEEAERCSNEAFRRFPKLPGIVGTRGYALIQMGKVVEGLRLVESAFHDTSDETSRALNACCLAIGAAKLGQIPNAKKHLQNAERLDPRCTLLAMASNRVRSEEELVSSGHRDPVLAVPEGVASHPPSS